LRFLEEAEVVEVEDIVLEDIVLEDIVLEDIVLAEAAEVVEVSAEGASAAVVVEAVLNARQGQSQNQVAAVLSVPTTVEALHIQAVLEVEDLKAVEVLEAADLAAEEAEEVSK
jgi:hypothetical protein